MTSSDQQRDPMTDNSRANDSDRDESEKWKDALTDDTCALLWNEWVIAGDGPADPQAVKEIIDEYEAMLGEDEPWLPATPSEEARTGATRAGPGPAVRPRPHP
jgi:hypothetical protein